jgi:hypothetical protein
MRKEIIFLLAFLFIAGLWFTSCKSEKVIVTTVLVINAKKGHIDSAFYEGTFIKIFETVADMNSGQNIVLEGETSKDMNATISFTDVEPGWYYIHATGRTGNINMESFDSIEVLENRNNEKDIILRAKNDGILKVYARKDMIYFQGAIVKLYLSNQARQNDEAFITTLTELHGASPSDVYAIINDLDPRTYYLFVSTEYNGEKITGMEVGGNGLFVPNGVTSSVHIQLTN